MYYKTYFKCVLTEICLHSLSLCFYHTFLPCKAWFCSHSFQFYVRTLVFPTWVKMTPTHRKYYSIPVDSCRLPYPASSLLQPAKIGNQTEKLFMILLWADRAVQGARTATRYCRKWLLTTCTKALTCAAQVNTHTTRKAGAITVEYHTDMIPNPNNLGIWQNS